MKGSLIVISGPSGVGKGTLCKKILSQVEGIKLSISATTRAPRAGEVNGKDYYFMGKKTFEAKIHNGEFLEWAKVHDNYYGTLQEHVNKLLSEGQDVLLEIDVQGAFQVKKQCPTGVFIFVVPPSFQELKKRIIKRGSETKETLAIRLKNAKKELQSSFDYDYIVLNDDLSLATSKLKSIIIAERCRTLRNKSLLEQLSKE